MYKDIYKLIYSAKTAGEKEVVVWPGLYEGRINDPVAQVIGHFEQEGYTIIRQKHSFIINWERMPSKAAGLYESAVVLIEEAMSNDKYEVIMQCVLPKHVVKWLQDELFYVDPYGDDCTRISWGRSGRYLVSGKLAMRLLYFFSTKNNWNIL